MNKDQVLSLLRSALKIGGAALAAHGMSKAAAFINAEDVTGAILTVAGVLLSHFKHSDGDGSSQSGVGVAGSLHGLMVAAGLAGLLGTSGCTFTGEKTIINTPAVYNVSTDANGVLQSNLVSAASVKTVVKRERIWLPENYAVDHHTIVYGVEVSMTDASTQTPKVRAGIADDTWRWVPTATNKVYSPPITVSGEMNNKALPFMMSGKARFTSGETQVSATDTNATATAIVPGVPNDQK